jgi:hypothetical protein
VTDSVDESRSVAEQRTHQRLRLDRALRSEWASEQNAEWTIRIDLACYRHGVLLQGKKGNTRPLAGEQKFPAWATLAPDGAKGSVITRVAAREKKKAPGPCELRALLRDAPSKLMHEARPKARHRRCRTFRSDKAVYARALDRAHNLTSLVATRSELLPIASKAGNDRNASPGGLDFMPGGMTRRMKAHVSAMLTGKRFEYCTAGVPLQRVRATESPVQDDKRGLDGAFRLDKCPM